MSLVLPFLQLERMSLKEKALLGEDRFSNPEWFFQPVSFSPVATRFPKCATVPILE
jgi:hypothetical protein